MNKPVKLIDNDEGGPVMGQILLSASLLHKIQQKWNKADYDHCFYEFISGESILRLIKVRDKN